MRYVFLWDDDSDAGNVAHIAEHGLSPLDVEHAFDNVLRERPAVPAVDLRCSVWHPMIACSSWFMKKSAKA